MSCLNDFRVKLGGKEYAPLMLGGMGTNISTAELVLALEKLGGIANLSDAMMMEVCDRLFGTTYSIEKAKLNMRFKGQEDKTGLNFNLDHVRDATMRYVQSVMEKATGNGLVLINCMEKLTMNDTLETLKVRLNAALDAGIQGITLSAGLHLSSLRLVSDNPRFREALFGIVVSSRRALNLFLRRTKNLNRLPDYVVVEGPLAGGHLGFGEDWRDYTLGDIVRDVKEYLKSESLDIPVFAAGGIFTGADAVKMMTENGADGVQVATRFTIAQESGLPLNVKKAYLNSKAEDVEVNHASPTGYLMRMLKQSPALQGEMPPNCEPYGYLLNHGKCPYCTQWWERRKDPSIEKTRCCLCTHMKLYNVWTCGANVSRLKEVTQKDANGNWIIPSAESIYNDYLFGTR
ncbi:MAG TPA: nitronate monooxygenase [Candidatus Aphodousia gallistercoris]|nr:nitronate monooxygenase [Candidatus Aphodousia gallistercoris]